MALGIWGERRGSSYPSDVHVVKDRQMGLEGHTRYFGKQPFGHRAATEETGCMQRWRVPRIESIRYIFGDSLESGEVNWRCMRVGWQKSDLFVQSNTIKVRLRGYYVVRVGLPRQHESTSYQMRAVSRQN